MSMRGPPVALPGLSVSSDRPESQDGMLLFIQYAFMPNRLRYCGTDDHDALFDYWEARETDAGLNQLLQTFTGALPYLKLIAHANGLSDPFDRRVVHAYWVGNELLEAVPMRELFASLTERFGPQLQDKAMDYITRKVPLGARPHHSFHVFDVHSRVGELTHGLDVMEHCRISWGQITAVEPGHFTIEARPLVLTDGRLALGQPVLRRVVRQLDAKGFTDTARAGDWISVHWRCACDVLTPEDVKALEAYTRQHMRLANLTL